MSRAPTAAALWRDAIWKDPRLSTTDKIVRWL